MIQIPDLIHLLLTKVDYNQFEIILSGRPLRSIPQFLVNGKWGRYSSGVIINKDSTVLAEDIEQIEDAKWNLKELSIDLETLHDNLDDLLKGHGKLLTFDDIVNEELLVFGEMPDESQ